MKIAVIGAGYVGLSIASLLAQNNQVRLYDIDHTKLAQVNASNPLFCNCDLLRFENLMLEISYNLTDALKDASYVIICTSTDYDEKKKCFDTSSVEKVISDSLSINPLVCFVIRSTIPVGFTAKMKKKYQTNNIYFSPEFLREGNALYDSLYPSRVIIGDQSEISNEFVQLVLKSVRKQNVDVLLTGSSEAESIKLFSNTYLALRISYINEIDTYAEVNNLRVEDILLGIGLDKRIGLHYNNPSFGYGGYCLPKDTKQLLSDYERIPQNLIEAIVKSNETRKQHIVQMILNKKSKVIGIYRLTMKKKSDNFRSSAIIDIIKSLCEADCKIVIYEPLLKELRFESCLLCNDLKEFKQQSDLIIANRLDEQLLDVKAKVYTRDVYQKD